MKIVWKIVNDPRNNIKYKEYKIWNIREYNVINRIEMNRTRI